ncbi:hypothetical protein F5Y16DRAFT_420524 [Xylariaceae sp. FL0255]|nr:hypothetical protein F5Y16DRAFT_420524 [Xylariaceae sp. FL0255]
MVDEGHHSPGGHSAPPAELLSIHNRYCSINILRFIWHWLDQTHFKDPFPGTHKDVGQGWEQAFGDDNVGFSAPSIPSSNQDDETIMDGDIESMIIKSDKSSLERRSNYREGHLNYNEIYIIDVVDDSPSLLSLYKNSVSPGNVKALLERINLPSQSSKAPTKMVKKLFRVLQDMQHAGSGESIVAAWFRDYCFPKDAYQDVLRILYDIGFQRDIIPGGNSINRVAWPVPDISIGYRAIKGMFTEGQLLAGKKVDPPPGRASQFDLNFPFLVVEFKAQGHVNGNLWVATNQCAGASASCAELIERLNTKLRKRSGYSHGGIVNSIDNIAFSLAIDQCVAKLYATSKTQDGKYHMRKVASYFLERPAEFDQLQRHVESIIDWGERERFKAI